MKVYEGAELQWLSLLNSAIYRDEWPVSRLGHSTPIEKAPPKRFKRWFGGPQNEYN